MSSDNKRVKNEMIRIFGKKCFIEELKIRSMAEIEAERRKYVGKKQLAIMDQLTYHHILERCRRRKSNSRKWSYTSIHKSSMV